MYAMCKDTGHECSTYFEGQSLSTVVLLDFVNDIETDPWLHACNRLYDMHKAKTNER